MSTMKVLLSLTILLASGIIDIGANAAAVIVKRDDLSDAHLADINHERAQVAEQRNIANMNKLTWSEELAEMARNTPRNCEQLENGANYRYDIWEKHSKKGQKGLIKADIRNSALFFPSQTEVGCDGSFTCETPDIKWNGLCYVGPQMQIEESDFKDGTPGSKCGDLKSEGGLCIPTQKRASKGHSQSDLQEKPDRKELSNRPSPSADPKTSDKKDSSDSTDGSASAVIMISSLIPMLLMI